MRIYIRNRPYRFGKIMPHIITYFGNMTGMDPTNAMERIREIASLPGELERPGIICVIGMGSLNLPFKLREHANRKVLGEPGVDRGTQCARLAKDLGASHLSVVDLLKEGASRLLVTHKIDVMAYMRVGKLVPKEAVQSVLEDGIIDSINAGKIRILLDGFPRSMDQTKLFETGVSAQDFSETAGKTTDKIADTDVGGNQGSVVVPMVQTDFACPSTQSHKHIRPG